LADWQNVVQVGRPLRSFVYSTNGYSCKVYFTANWIVCVPNAEGDRLSILRAKDVVYVSRIPSAKQSLLERSLTSDLWVAIMDRQGERVELAFPEADGARFLAEVLSRVPWAVDRFGPALPQGPPADSGQPGARAEQQIGDSRLTDQTPPTSPA
jgi:hypothetical protein